jgi:TPR repeat protein
MTLTRLSRMSSKRRWNAPRESAGDAAWSAGDWPKAFEEFLSQASGGDPNAQVRIGRMFYEGLGRAPDFHIAESWFRKAAKQGSAEAKYRLGLLYSEDRKGAPFDLDVAVAFFSEAAEGSPEAAFRLGRLYWDGVGVPEDRAKARELIKASATAGSSAAVDWIRENDK